MRPSNDASKALDRRLTTMGEPSLGLPRDDRGRLIEVAA